MSKIYRLFACLFFLASFQLQNLQAQEVTEFKIPTGIMDQTGSEIPPIPLISEMFLDEGDYYLVREEKVFIRRDTNKIAVKFKDNALSSLNKLSGQTKQQSDFLKQALNTQAIDAEFTVAKQLTSKNITIINIKFKSTSSQKLLSSQIQEMANTDLVEYAYPVFTSSTGINEIIPTDEILVRFTTDYRQAEVESFCAEQDLALLRKTALKT